jgi:hypothetical protein
MAATVFELANDPQLTAMPELAIGGLALALAARWRG